MFVGKQKFVNVEKLDVVVVVVVVVVGDFNIVLCVCVSQQQRLIIPSQQILISLFSFECGENLVSSVGRSGDTQGLVVSVDPHSRDGSWLKNILDLTELDQSSDDALLLRLPNTVHAYRNIDDQLSSRPYKDKFPL